MDQFWVPLAKGRQCVCKDKSSTTILVGQFLGECIFLKAPRSHTIAKASAVAALAHAVVRQVGIELLPEHCRWYEKRRRGAKAVKRVCTALQFGTLPPNDAGAAL